MKQNRIHTKEERNLQLCMSMRGGHDWQKDVCKCGWYRSKIKSKPTNVLQTNYKTTRCGERFSEHNSWTRILMIIWTLYRTRNGRSIFCKNYRAIWPWKNLFANVIHSATLQPWASMFHNFHLYGIKHSMVLWLRLPCRNRSSFFYKTVTESREHRKTCLIDV